MKASFFSLLGLTIPVAIHADHFGKKSTSVLFEAGITSIAIDASHMPDGRKLLADIELNPYLPGRP